MSRPLTSMVTALLLAANLALVVALFTSDNSAHRRKLSIGLMASFAALVGFAAKRLSAESAKFAREQANDPNRPTVIASMPDEMSASAIVAKLEEHGIKARAVGGYTSGFQTEIAGDVKVVVPNVQAGRAHELLTGEEDSESTNDD